MDCILLAAGQGVRARLGYPKQLARLDGKPIFIHTLQALSIMTEIKKLLLAVPPGREDDFTSLNEQYGITKVQIISGGLTRQASVANCLPYVTSEKVMIHEAVRPFLTREFLRDLLEAGLKSRYPVIPCCGVPFTVLLNSNVYPVRSEVYNVQLPQIFPAALLKQAHYQAWDKGNGNYPEDSSLVFAETGVYPCVIPGLEQNIKITTPLDLLYAEVLHREGYCGCDRWESGDRIGNSPAGCG